MYNYKSVKEINPSPRYLPRNVITGDTFKFSLIAKDYLPEDGYTYKLSMSYLNETISITGTVASAEDNEVEFYANAATTADWATGKYRYSIYAGDGTDSYTVESGLTDLDARTDIASGSDNKTHAQKVLSSIEAVIEGRATKDQESYSISGRSLQRTPLTDLLKMRDYYKDRVWKEKNKKYKAMFWM